MNLIYNVEKSNLTINNILKNELNISNRLLFKLINNKLVYKNNQLCDTRNVANVGDVIQIDLSYEEDNSNIKPTKIDLNIIFEDDSFLVLNKPKGLAVHPSILHFEDTLSNGVKYYFDKINLHKKIRPVNRLDLDTSGLIVFAKNEYVQECLIKQMSNNTFKKEYVPDSEVLGVLTEFKRKGRDHSVDSAGYKLYARFWNLIYPLRWVMRKSKVLGSKVKRFIFRRK